jgi:hypothetical protein
MELYPKKEQQAASNGSPGKSAVITSQQQQPQPLALMVKASVPLSPIPLRLEPSLQPLYVLVTGLDVELEVEGGGYMALPNLNFYHGWDSPY